MQKAVLVVILFILLPVVAAEAPREDESEFYFARLIYRNNGQRGNRMGGDACGGGGWRTDTPDADQKYAWGIQRLTGLRVHYDPRNPVHAVGILDPELFHHPFIYAVEPGSMDLNEEEAARLREYLLRGGFWHLDDFWGQCQLENVLEQLHKVFPDRDPQDIPLNHDVFHTFYDVDHIAQIPNISNARRIFRGDPNARTWEQPNDREPRILGIFDDHHRLMVVVTYNSDLGDAWEWLDDQEYPASLTTLAYREGIDFIMYSMTH